jgi:hypothetical protein
MVLFRVLTKDEKEEFQRWARDNYKPGYPINGTWHVVVQQECVKMNAEWAGIEPIASSSEN